MPLDPSILERLQTLVAKNPGELLPDEAAFLVARRSYLNDEQKAKFAEVLPTDEPFLTEANNDAAAVEASVEAAKDEVASEPTPETPPVVSEPEVPAVPETPAVEPVVTEPAPIAPEVDNQVDNPSDAVDNPTYPAGTPVVPIAEAGSETPGTSADAPAVTSPVDEPRDHSKDPDYKPEA